MGGNGASQGKRFRREWADAQGSRGKRGKEQGGKQMLVLSRKLNEEIWIGDGICVRVLETDGGRVKLGVKAPPEVPIFRRELLDKIRRREAEVPAVSQV